MATRRRSHRDEGAGAPSALAIEKVRYVGDAVAAVVGSSPAAASDAVALVEVDYEPLDAVTDAEQATADGAPVVHDDAPGNLAFDWAVGAGDYDAAAAEADVVVSERIVNQRLIPNPMEARGIMADYNGGTEQLTIWTSTQIPHLVRLLFALVTGHPEHKVRVIAPDVGGGFGCKLYLYAEEVICGIIAKNLERPVKWIESRTENYVATTHGRDHIADAEICGTKDGIVTGLKVHVYANLGGYLSTFAPAIPTILFGLMLGGCYKFENLSCQVKGVFTNTTPVDAYRGAGRPEATYVVERMMERYAHEIGRDVLGVRRRNFVRPVQARTRHAHRRHIRLRQLPRRTRSRTRQVRLPSLQARATRRSSRWSLARRRLLDIHRDLRHGTICRCRRIGRRRRPLGIEHRPRPPDRHGYRLHRHFAARTGPRDHAWRR